MDNERIPEELKNYARMSSYFIGAHFKGMTNTGLEKILVKLTTTRNQLINGVVVGDDVIFQAGMIDSFIDGVRGRKPPGY